MPTAYSSLRFVGGPRTAGAKADARRRVPLAGALTVTAVVGAIAFLLAAHGAGHARQARPIIEEVDRLADLAGFGIAQVFLSGHRMTLDSDIFDAMELKSSRSLVGFDSGEARGRIERLPWIRTAAISRIFPDTLSVSVTERSPFAVWHRGAGDALIDETGRVLGPAPAGIWGELPRVSGDGAAARAARIISQIARYPSLAKRVEVAVLVGQRRWSLQLKEGPEIRLPADGDAQALSALMARPDHDALLDQRHAVVDLRLDGGVLLRPRKLEAGGGAAAASRPQPSG